MTRRMARMLVRSRDRFKTLSGNRVSTEVRDGEAVVGIGLFPRGIQVDNFDDRDEFESYVETVTTDVRWFEEELEV